MESINRTGSSAVRSPTDSALNDDTKLASLTADILVFRRQIGPRCSIVDYDDIDTDNNRIDVEINFSLTSNPNS
jgi:hypothetical protein